MLTSVQLAGVTPEVNFRITKGESTQKGSTLALKPRDHHESKTAVSVVSHQVNLGITQGKITQKGIHPGFDTPTSPKHGYQWPHENPLDLCPRFFFKKKQSPHPNNAFISRSSGYFELTSCVVLWITINILRSFSSLS